MIDEGAFEALANETLGRLLDRIDDALGDRLDIDLQGGVLTIELDSGDHYVINKHAPTREIWMSSPRSGATHFAYQGDAGWVSTRDARTLSQALSQELAGETGIAVDLD